MKALKTLLENLNLHNIHTYIQSGNMVFQSDAIDSAPLSSQISAEIKKTHGFEPKVLLLKLEEVEQVIRVNPFPEVESKPEALHVGFLASTPANPDLEALDTIRGENERFELVGRLFYLRAPSDVGRSKLAARAERLLGAPMTDRNWRTINKIVEIAKKER